MVDWIPFTCAGSGQCQKEGSACITKRELMIGGVSKLTSLCNSVKRNARSVAVSTYLHLRMTPYLFTDNSVCAPCPNPQIHTNSCKYCLDLGHDEIPARLTDANSDDTRGCRFPSWRRCRGLHLRPSSSTGEILGPVHQIGWRRRHGVVLVY